LRLQKNIWKNSLELGTGTGLLHPGYWTGMDRSSSLIFQLTYRDTYWKFANRFLGGDDRLNFSFSQDGEVCRELIIWGAKFDYHLADTGMGRLLVYWKKYWRSLTKGGLYIVDDIVTTFKCPKDIREKAIIS